MGLGVAHRETIAAAGRSLKTAREAADAARKLGQGGIDPIGAKASERERTRQALAEKKAALGKQQATLARVARPYHERVIEGSRTPWSSPGLVNRLVKSVRLVVQGTHSASRTVAPLAIVEPLDVIEHISTCVSTSAIDGGSRARV